jgi:hypothetical protein
VLFPVTSRYDVPLMLSRGYSSVSFLHDGALAIATQDKPTHIYYFGDHDPSGIDIGRVVEDELRELATNAVATFQRAAVTEDQISEWNLPTRPTKSGDASAKKSEGDSVELDTIPPATLRALVEECIVRHIDAKAWKQREAQERADPKRLTKLIGS